MTRAPLAPDPRASFWQAALGTERAATLLPIAAPATALGLVDMRSVPLELASGLDPERNDRLEAAFAILLGRYADDTAVFFGTCAGDGVLPRRVRIDEEATARAFVSALADARGASCAHRADEASIRRWARWPAGSPLFEHAFAPAKLASGCALLLDPEASAIVYDARRVAPEAAERAARHLARLFRALSEGPETPVGELAMLQDDERHRLLFAFNDTEAPFPGDRCLHQLFEEQVDRQPDAPAVLFGDERRSYAEIEARANRLAHHLRALGVGPDVPVGIFVERSIEMVVAILGVLKAGGAYAPLDPSYPVERLAFMLRDAAAPVLLTQSHLAGGVPQTDARVVLVDSELPDASASRPRIDGLHPDCLAYVIYTSGSTGTPKGVAIVHRGALNNIHDLNTRYALTSADRLLALSSPSFDMCVYEVLGTLAAGGAIVMPEPERVADPGAWHALVERHGVSVWNSAPQLLEMFVDHAERHGQTARSLRVTILGGDWVPVSLPDRFKALAAPNARVAVLGGATEASIHSTLFEVEATDPRWRSIPYGRPMRNQSCLVLDSRRRLCPIGVPGELHLGGVGLARGYLGRPELTADKFIDHPFAPGERLYRTGDRVRMRADGVLDLLGRIDFMVKIRGQRIELGEIEAALRRHPEVREAVVVAREPDEARDEAAAAAERRLCAYVTCAEAAPRQEGSAEQVDAWREVYDAAYGGEEASDPAFDLTGWISSYSGKPIAPSEMRVWVDSTVERIAALGPRRILEIGCGTGLLLFRLAPQCERYVGTDFSRVVLERLGRHVKQRGLEQVELFERDARELSDFEPGSFDAVVLNSIVLQFPDGAYLEEVLAGAARLLAPGGAIFVGDVRSLPLFSAYHTSVQLFRAEPRLPSEALSERVAHAMRDEEELVMDSRLFSALAQRIDGIEGVSVQLKRGRHRNELSKFRYDVTLHQQPAPSAESRTVAWDGDLRPVEELLREGVERLVVRGVPDARIAEDVCASELLDSGAPPATAGELAAAARAEAGALSAQEPESFWELAKSHGYAAALRPADGARFDVLFCRGPQARFDEELEENRPISDYLNDPLRAKRARQLAPALIAHLEACLPEHMVPRAVVVLDKFPLTPNGKVNRRALPPPPLERPRGETVAPRDAVERVIAEVWREVLATERFGVHDDFLDLGGHSLGATRVCTHLRDVFAVEIPLSVVMSARTVAELARELGERGRRLGVDVQDIARLYLEIEALGERELDALSEVVGDGG